MFRIAKNLVKTFEQSVQDTLSLSQDANQLDVFFQSISPNLIAPQYYQQDSQQKLDTIDTVNYEFQSNFNNRVAGLRIIWVDEFQLQLQSFFDFIVGINDDPLPLISNQHNYTYPNYNAIIQIFNNNLNHTIKLNVWSAKGGTFRDEIGRAHV